MMSIRVVASFLSVLVLASCVNLYAGIARYEVKPFYDADTKEWICCTATVTSGKNAGSVQAHITKSGNDFVVDLAEQSVDASSSIAAAAITASAVGAAVSSAAVSAAQFAPK